MNDLEKVAREMEEQHRDLKDWIRRVDEKVDEVLKKQTMILQRLPAQNPTTIATRQVAQMKPEARTRTASKPVLDRSAYEKRRRR